MDVRFDEVRHEVVARMRALEGRDGVLSVSLCHGFPWADVADLGVQVLVVAALVARELTAGQTIAQRPGRPEAPQAMSICRLSRPCRRVVTCTANSEIATKLLKHSPLTAE